MTAPIDAVASVAAVTGVGPTAPTAPTPSAERFNAAFDAATARAAQAEDGQALARFVDPLLSLNRHSAALGEAADVTGADAMRPGELLELTMRSHEFLFHCELVSNVANRSSDGVQQLFRQQS